jgi:hypothetical protein
MPGPRSRQDRSAARDDALADQWLAAIAANSPVEQLREQIAALTEEQVEAGIRGLASGGNASAVPLLTDLARRPSRRIAEAAVEALGAVRAQEAVDALQEIAETADDRSLQKAARRGIFRLASQGIQSEPAPPTTASVGGIGTATLYRVIASSFDGSGSRSVWFAAERPLGGIYQIAVSLNDVKGLMDVGGRDTTRKRFAEQETRMRETDVAAWAELPVEYGRQLVQEGIGLAQATGHMIPLGYAQWAELIGNPSEPFTQALVYQELSAFEMRMHPTLEAETPRLFAQPEVEAWFFTPEAMKKWIQQLAESPASRLLITPESEEERAQRVLREAAKELLPPPVRTGLRRRLEETAYIFMRTERQADARRAVQAAATIEEDRPLRPPHPFLLALLQRSLQIALEVERSGFEPFGLARVP